MTTPKTRVGLTPPRGAAQIVQLATNAGWRASTSWGLENGGLPFHRVTLARPASMGRTYVHAVLVWHTNEDKGGLEISNAVVRMNPRGQWTDLPNLRTLSNMIHAR